MQKLQFKIISLFFLLVISYYAYGQSNKFEVKELINRAKKHLTTNTDSSLFFYQQARNIASKYQFKNLHLDALNGLVNVAFIEKDYKKCFSLASQASKEASSINSNSCKECIAAFANLGILYSMFGNLEKGNNYLNKSINLINNFYAETQEEQSIVHGMLMPLYQAFGNNQIQLGDNESAFIYLNHAIRAQYEKDANYYINKSLLFSKMGEVQFQLRKIKSSISWYHKSSEILSKEESKSGLWKSRKIVALIGLAESYLELGKVDSSFHYLAKSEKIENEKIKNSRIYELLGQTLLVEHKYSEAKNQFIRAIKINTQQFGNDKNLFNSRQYFHLADLEQKQNNLKGALSYYQQAIVKMTFDYEDTTFISNPSPQKVISEPLGFKILKNKAQVLRALFDQTQDFRYLEAALDAAKVAAQLVEKTRQEIVTQGSKQKLAGEALEVYETGLKVALQLHELTGQSEYLEQAFAFAESNKAILLLESINETVAKNYGGIPDSLLEQEKDLRINIAFYDKQLYEEKQKGEAADTTRIQLWENQLFDFNQDYQALVKGLETDYPEYYEMKYNTTLASLNDLQQQILKPKEALVEYFVGTDSIYAFVVTKEETQVVRIPKIQDYDKPIFALRDAIISVDRGVPFYHQFMDNSSELYEQYLAPVIAKLPEHTQRLLLITDDALGYLPFEILLREHPQLEDNALTFAPNILQYVFEDYLINYHYSSTLLLKSYSHHSQPDLKPLFAMAPSFNTPLAQANRSCSVDQLYSLYCSEEEASTIENLFGGFASIGATASKQQFLEEAAKYRVLHLATHSCADEENPMLSQIYFNDGAISNYELFNLDLNAELAVLSACNTGTGKLVRGEGVMSLSKGFIHAGVPSTVMSLWAVDDCSTSKLMIKFYEFLKKGLPKDEALRQARLEYLEEADAFNQHPYYWAPFIQMGNSSPLNLPDKTHWWPWVVIAGIAFTGLGMWKWRQIQGTGKEALAKAA